MLKIWRILCLLPILAWANTLNDIQQRGVLRIGTEPNYFPFEFVNKTGNVVGFDIDVAKHMAKTMGVKLKIVPTAVDSAVLGILTNKYDIYMRGITLTQERNLKINFADPYFYSGQTLIARGEVASGVKDPSELNREGVVFVSKIGTTGERTAKRTFKKATYRSFETEQEALLELLSGRADVFVFDAPYNTVAMMQHPNADLHHFEKPITYEPLAWGLKPGDPDLLNWLNNYLRQIKNDGTYDKFHQKWFEQTNWINSIAESAG